MNTMNKNFRNHLVPFKFVYTLLDNTGGWVTIKKTEKTYGGVKSRNNLLYANDLTTAPLDKRVTTKKDIRVFDAGTKMEPYPTGAPNDRLTWTNRVAVCKTTGLGSSLVDDYVVIRTDVDAAVQICVGKDVIADYTKANAEGKWSEWTKYYYPLPYFTYYQVLGAEILDVDGNADMDLVVVVAPRNYYENMTGIVFVSVYIFHDINVDGSNQLTFNDGNGNLQVPSSTNILTSTTGLKPPNGCVIGDFYDRGVPGKFDILLFTGTLWRWKSR